MVLFKTCWLVASCQGVDLSDALLPMRIVHGSHKRHRPTSDRGDLYFS